MPLQTPTDRCETRVTSCVSLHQHIALAYSALCVTVSPTPTTQRVFKHPLTCGVLCVTISAPPTTQHVFKFPLKTPNPMCHCLSNTHNTACIQIPTENSESSVSLSLQHPRHNVRSNTHWNQWVLCVTVFPTPTIQCVFKCPLKTVSPTCHPLSNAHNTACVQTYTEKSESSVSYLSNTQNTTCSYNHWQEWVICVTISLTPHNIVRTCSLCPVSLCPNIHWQVWDIPTHSAYLLCPCIFPTPTALCVCLKTPINKSETHNTNTCSLCAMSLCPNTHQPVWDIQTHSTCSLCPKRHYVSNIYGTVCVSPNTHQQMWDTWHQHTTLFHCALCDNILPTFITLC